MEVLSMANHNNGGVYRAEGERFEVADDRIPDLEAARLVVSPATQTSLWEDAPDRILSPFPSCYEPLRLDPEVWDHAPRVLHMTSYDPGSSVYRYSSALNASGLAWSRLARVGDSNPHCSLRNFDIRSQEYETVALLTSADIVHVHMDYRTLTQELRRWVRPEQVIVRHYHGSVGPGESRRFVDNEEDALAGAVQIGARLYHRRFSPSMQWLPIPMPIADYGALAREHAGTREASKTFRIAHSPTLRAIKGTQDFLDVIQRLQARGVPVEAVLIEHMFHGEALAMKATCHATFDSFWLGLQGSGLEAAAMGQAVIAGDGSVRDEYIQEIGYCPYTFATTPDELESVIERMVMDRAWYAKEAVIVSEYCAQYHAYKAVAVRYRGIIDPVLEVRHGAAHA